MATSNFYVVNAKSLYVFGDTYEVEGEEITRDQWDWEELFEYLSQCGEEEGFIAPSEERNRWMDNVRNVVTTEEDWQTFGKGNAFMTETDVNSTIVLRSGYYSGMVFDYDVEVVTSKGDTFILSDYNGNVDDMVKDYLVTLEEIIKWNGSMHKWNVGTFKMHRENIRKWIEKRITDHVNKCEKFCKDKCDMELCVSARFSNGETWYEKVG